MLRNLNYIDKGLKCLSIEKSSQMLIAEEEGEKVLMTPEKVLEGNIYALIGIINISGVNYLTVVSDVDVVGKLYGVTIYKVKAVRLYPFNTQ